jgi:hypothetical protein
MTIVSHGPTGPSSPAPSLPRRITRCKRRYRSARRHFRGGCRAAVLRALTGARGCCNGMFSNVSEAAMACGSNTAYVAAAIVLIESENKTLIDRVLTGKVSLLAAAKEIRRLAELVTAYRKASAADRVLFARVIGPSVLFDNSATPSFKTLTGNRR